MNSGIYIMLYIELRCYRVLQRKYPSLLHVRATTKLYTPATSKDNGRASSHCGLTQRDKLREKEEDEGICQFILTIDITTVKWEF